MKGLLVKDFQYMLTQKTFFIMIITLGIALSFLTASAGFVVGYIVFILGFFTLNTITFDEMDNGFAYLFTLPISRKTYVLEKYIFGIFASAIATVIAVALGVASNAIIHQGDTTDILITGAVSFGLVCVFLALNLPIHLRFQGEKARMVLIMLMAAFLGIVVFLVNANFLSGETFANTIALVSGWGIVLRVLALIAALAVMFFISYLISIRVLNKKEF